MILINRFIHFLLLTVLCSTVSLAQKRIHRQSFYHPQHLEKQKTTIELQYIHGTHTGSWMSMKDYIKMPDPSESDTTNPNAQQIYIEKNSIYLEPAERGLQERLHNSMCWDSFYITVRVTGYFYTEKGYPTGYSIEREYYHPGRVFRFDSYKMIRGGIKNRKKKV